MLSKQDIRPTHKAAVYLVAPGCSLGRTTGATDTAVCFGRGGPAALEEPRTGVCRHTLAELANEDASPPCPDDAVETDRTYCRPCFDVLPPNTTRSAIRAARVEAPASTPPADSLALAAPGESSQAVGGVADWIGPG